jgi:hypothetical protein
LKRKGKGLKKSSTLVVKQDYFDNSLFSQRLSATLKAPTVGCGKSTAVFRIIILLLQQLFFLLTKEVIHGKDNKKRVDRVVK